MTQRCPDVRQLTNTSEKITSQLGVHRKFGVNASKAPNVLNELMTPLSDKELDQLAADYGKSFSPDVEAGLAKVRGRLQSAPSGAVVRPLGRRRWFGAAAAVLLLLSAGYFGLVYDPATVYANNEVAPLEVALPDGTAVVLQQGARLTHTADFNETERRITLEGQGFFVVHKDKTRPFLVGNQSADLRVTGTEFNLRIEGEELEVEVSEGSVELSAAGEKMPVKANECGLVKSNKSLTLMEAPHLNRHAWRTGKLYFQDAELPVVLEALRTNFGLEVEAPANCNYAVSGTFSAEDPPAILENVALLGGLTVENKQGEANGLLLVGVCR